LEHIQKQIIEAIGVSGRWFTPREVKSITNVPGAYILLLRLDESVNVCLPRQVCRQLLAGWYAYSGSARNKGGIRARLIHHFNENKKQHWHIDRLTINAARMAALPVADGDECNLLGKLIQLPDCDVVIKGFGSSDCRNCESHLLAVSEY
jgi:Uri superfamily endonuclease